MKFRIILYLFIIFLLSGNFVYGIEENITLQNPKVLMIGTNLPSNDKSNLELEWKFLEQKQKTYDTFLIIVTLIIALFTLSAIIFGFLFYKDVHALEESITEKAEYKATKLFDKWRAQQFQEDKKEIIGKLENQNTRINDLICEVEKMKILNKLKTPKDMGECK